MEERVEEMGRYRERWGEMAPKERGTPLERPLAATMAYEMPVPRVETTHEQSTSTEKEEPPA